MRVPTTKDGDGNNVPDLPDGYQGGVQLTADGDYLLTDYDDRDERITALEAEVRGMRDRVAAVEATGDAAKLRDAVSGPDGR